MELNNSTILITGGTNGIGLEFARQLLQKNANVIVTGRDFEKLNKTKEMFPRINIVRSDVSSASDIKELFDKITQQFPDLNMIINNAGIMRSVEILDNEADIENAFEEIDINFSGTVRMIHQFLPHLMQKDSAAIVNITSGLAFVPFITSPIYCGTKAAVHIFSQALRIKLKDTKVNIFEVAPPMTDKPLQTAYTNSKEKRAMKIDKMVSIAIEGIEKNKVNIKPGLSNTMWWMSRIAPKFFTKMINKNIEKAKKKNY